MADRKNQTKDTAKTVDHTKFTMKDVNDKPFKILVPDDSLDEHAREVVEGVYRHC